MGNQIVGDGGFVDDPYAKYLQSQTTANNVGSVAGAVNAGLNLLQLPFSAYAAYREGEDRKRALREERRRYEAQQRMQREMMEYRKYLDKLAGQFQAGEYGQNLADRALQQGLRFSS